ncbi:MAG: type I DNA topoisomerase [Eubacteriales bacterium]
MPNLVIIESPYKAPAIKSYLGSNYKVFASVGHVRDLPKSTLGVDIENDFTPRYINIRGKGELIRELKKEAKACTKIYFATDPDREGEAISWHLSNVLGIPLEQTKRITFNEVTKAAVKAAVKNPRTIDMNLVNAQQTRRILDRIVGYKLSPFLWKTVKSGLSAGRVQSVATRIIVEREEEIRAFVTEEYWTIEATLATAKGQTLRAKYYGGISDGGKRELKNKADADAVLAAVDGKPFTVASVKQALRVKNPTAPFITSTMQQEASRKLGFQSAKTMKIAQELYEGINLGSENGGMHGLITYMRTDSQRVSSEASDAARSLICEKWGEKYYPKTPNVYKSKSNAQDAHEAIRPSSLDSDPDKIKKCLSNDQYKLYKLIWNRFISSQMAPAELDTVTADIVAADQLFRASGYTVRFAGYMAVYEESEDARGNNSDDTPEKTKIPDIHKDENLTARAVTPAQHFTEPPARYNEATLVKFLEERGIGRPSTYATIITTIISRGYVNREGKALKPTPLGEITTKLMKESFPDIVDYAFTAGIEDELDSVEKGEDTMLHVLSGFYGSFERDLTHAEETVGAGSIEIPVEETDIVCEKCGAKMIIKNGRYGKFAACPNYPECKNTKPLDRDGNVAESKAGEVTDIVCEKCGAPMVMRTGRYGSFLACSKYPECKNTKRIAKPIGVPCPICGSPIVTKHGKNRTTFYSCEKYPDCTFSSWDMPTAESCPECGKMLFRKKGKPLLVCHDENCGYKRPIENAERGDTPVVDNPDNSSGGDNA